MEIHRYENEFVLTWAKSELELEVPRHLENLFVRGFGGDVKMRDFAGSFRLEGLGGNFDIEGVHRPFRIRSVGGSVRIRDLAITDGSSHINTTGGDVEIDTAPEAAVEVKASTSLGGSLSLPQGATIVEGRTRRKGTAMLGSGTAHLRIDTVAGWIRVRGEAGSQEPHTGPTSVRDAAGESTADTSYEDIDTDNGNGDDDEWNRESE